MPRKSAKNKGKNQKNTGKTPKKQVKLVMSKSKGLKGPKAPLWMNLVTGVILLFLIASLYSFVTQRQGEVEQIPISQVAGDIREGEIESIEISGVDLSLVYKDETVREAQKELNGSLIESLRAYGVTAEELETVSITAKSDGGFGFIANGTERLKTSVARFFGTISFFGAFLVSFNRQSRTIYINGDVL